MSPFFSKIEQMHDLLLSLWKQEEDIQKVAFETSKIMASFSLNNFFSEELVLKELLGLGIKSYYPAGSFSDFNCLLKENSLFRIELYFWDRLDTGIHSHPFHGSFQCLKGELIVQDYSFTASKKTNGSREITLGELSLLKTQKVSPGNVYAINSGNDHLHKTIHTQPTVNLCIRSFTDPLIPNYNFLYPDLRVEKKSLSIEEEKKLELFNYLWGKSEHNNLLNSIFEQFDLPAIINFYTKGPKLLEEYLIQEASIFFLKGCEKIILENNEFAQVIESVQKNQLFMDKVNFAFKNQIPIK